MKTITLDAPMQTGITYRIAGKLKWHEKLRVHIAYFLVKSIKKPNTMTFTTS